MGKLYTRRGDEGWTALFDGTAVRKDDVRVAAYGTVDELNAQLGLAVSAMRTRSDDHEGAALGDRLLEVQRELFSLGADLATPLGARNRSGVPAISAEQVSRLENWIDEAGAAVPPLKTFVLPGGDPLAAQMHVCRTICRRAERCTVTAMAEAPLNPQVLKYLNRLGDLLFAWARLVNHQAGAAEQPWDG